MMLQGRNLVQIAQMGRNVQIRTSLRITALQESTGNGVFISRIGIVFFNSLSNSISIISVNRNVIMKGYVTMESGLQLRDFYFQEELKLDCQLSRPTLNSLSSQGPYL